MPAQKKPTKKTPVKKTPTKSAPDDELELLEEIEQISKSQTKPKSTGPSDVILMIAAFIIGALVILAVYFTYRAVNSTVQFGKEQTQKATEVDADDLDEFLAELDDLLSDDEDAEMTDGDLAIDWNNRVIEVDITNLGLSSDSTSNG
ncbi:MAG: hypothetical protein ABH846_03800, partial [Patescibacteria group bacterium]